MPRSPSGSAPALRRTARQGVPQPRAGRTTACKAAPGTDLVTATSHQAEFTRKTIAGTLMGLWSPAFARTFNMPGYHLHFLSADRRSGGHVLAVRGRDLTLQVMDANHLVMALPETPQFLAADLTGDP